MQPPSVSPRPIVRGAAAILLRQKGPAHEALLLRRRTAPFAGEWFPVEGRLRADEPPLAAILREIREETGLVPLRLYRDVLEPQIVPSRGYDVHLSVFVGFVSANATVVLNHEHSHCEWLSLDAAITRVPLPAQRATLQRVQSAFVAVHPAESLRVV